MTFGVFLDFGNQNRCILHLLALNILLHELSVLFHLPPFCLAATTDPILVDALPMEEMTSPPQDLQGSSVASVLTVWPSSVSASPGLSACTLGTKAYALATLASGPTVWPSGMVVMATSSLDRLAEGIAAPVVEGMATSGSRRPRHSRWSRHSR